MHATTLFKLTRKLAIFVTKTNTMQTWIGKRWLHRGGANNSVQIQFRNIFKQITFFLIILSTYLFWCCLVTHFSRFNIITQQGLLLPPCSFFTYQHEMQRRFWPFSGFLLHTSYRLFLVVSSKCIFHGMDVYIETNRLR